MTDTIVWTMDGCHYCQLAKNLLSRSGIPYEERNISNEWSKEQLLEAIPNVTQVPQIVLHGEHIGNYNDLEKYAEMHDMHIGNAGF